MTTKDLLVDKSLGMAGIAIGVLSCIMIIDSMSMILKGPSIAQRLEGFGRISITSPIGVISLYIGYLLIRYPEIRRTSAAEVARLAKRQKTPISPRWMEK